MKILVLGSDGQIGKPLTTYLSKLGHNVIEFDNYSDAHRDLRIPHILNDIIIDVDFVFFLAFDVGGATYLKLYQDTYGFISNNVKIMNNTFDSLKLYEKPFIFVSSQMSEMSHSSYGILKRIGEQYTKCLDGKIVRLWNVYGPEKLTAKTHVITDFITSARNEGTITMKTTGTERRQFLYVEDCCRCFNILMEKFYDISSMTFDVSSFHWMTIKDLAQIIASNFNCEVIPGTEVDDVQRYLTHEPSRNILNYWHPVTDIEAGIKHCIKDLT